MKKVINGKLYNTESAKEVGTYYSKYSRNDFYYFEEHLYQKRTGEFFLYGWGGAASKYSQSYGQNEWCSGEQIEPLSYKTAMKWAEEHLDGDEYCEIFGEPDEDNEKVTIGIQISKGAAEILRKKAAKEGMTQSRILESAVYNIDQKLTVYIEWEDGESTEYEINLWEAAEHVNQTHSKHGKICKIVLDW